MQKSRLFLSCVLVGIPGPIQCVWYSSSTIDTVLFCAVCGARAIKLVRRWFLRGGTVVGPLSRIRIFVDSNPFQVSQLISGSQCCVGVEGSAFLSKRRPQSWPCFACILVKQSVRSGLCVTMGTLVVSKIIGKKIAKLRFMPVKEPIAQREHILAVASWDDDVSLLQ